MLYTSYFANIRNLPASIERISIAHWPPRWQKRDVSLEYRKLAPPSDVLEKYKRDGDEEYYIREFQRCVLGRLNPGEVVRELHALTDKPHIALLCYEKPGKFCHRHLVAEWLREHEIACYEWTNGGGTT